MASRFETVPEDFKNHLRESVPGFKEEQCEHQFELARMVWLGANKDRQHSHFKGCMTFSHVELEKKFGRSNFEKINDRLNFFSRTAHWSKLDKLTRGFQFSEGAGIALKEYLASPPWETTTKLLMADGKSLKTIPAAILSKDKLDVTTRAWVNAKKLSSVKVDLNELQKLQTDFQTACDQWRSSEDFESDATYPVLDSCERVIKMIVKFRRMAMTDVAGIGHIVHHYQEAQSGRLYPLGISLASAQTVIKDAALTGNWEYDISNCHFAILVQMAATFNYACPAITDYLNNKAETRRVIAEEVGITVRQAKSCLVALLYGARASTRPKSAIPSLIDVEPAKRLYAHPLFKGLQYDIQLARNAILSKCARSPKGRLKNAFGKSIPGTTKNEALMAHLLQGVEAKALQAVINEHPDDIILVQHDGFVSSRPLDVGALSKAISAATGYDLKLEERRLVADPVAYFESRGGVRRFQNA